MTLWRSLRDALKWHLDDSNVISIPNSFLDVVREERDGNETTTVRTSLSDAFIAVVTKNGRTTCKIMPRPDLSFLDESALVLRDDVRQWLDEHMPGRWRLVLSLQKATTKFGSIAVKHEEDEVLFRLAWSEHLGGVR